MEREESGQEERGEKWRVERTRVNGRHGGRRLRSEIVELCCRHTGINAHDDLLSDNCWVDVLNGRLFDNQNPKSLRNLVKVNLEGS